MKTITLLLKVSVLCSILLVIISGCSADISGGTGVGNPTAVASLSVLVDSSYVSSNARGGGFPIAGEDGLVLNVTSVEIAVKQIDFCRVDGGYDSLCGPYIFNAMTGEVTPPIKFSLSTGSYNSVHLDMSNDDPDFMDGYTIILKGDFEYKNFTKLFVLKLHYVKLNKLKPYYYPPVGTNPIEVVENDLLRLIVDLEAQNWMKMVKLKKYLDKGDIAIGLNGNLIIDNSISEKMYKTFKKEVLNNVKKGGYLYLTK